jgi:RNA polymerase sigma factor (sigma-70 family)
MTSGIIDESAIAEALRLGEPQGIERLLRLQGLGLWHGDLADMRRDSARRPSAEPDVPPSSETDAATHFAMLLRVKAAVNRLPPREREVLQLHYFEGLPDSKIAERLGTTSIHAQRLIFRSLEHVREIYLSGVDAKEP